MQNIVGTQVHDEILRLLDRAERVVVLVSPFIRPWPELRRALARAVARGVGIEVITRGPRGAPDPAEMGIFEDLEATIREVPGLHLKAYLSEREAIHTSVNLTRESVGKSMESSLRFDRTADADGWSQLFEVWQKTWDDAERAGEGEPMSADSIFLDPRARSDAGDLGAREHHRYCIVCGTTASTDGDIVVCLRCRAGAIAADREPWDVSGSHCARCNGPYRHARPERPFCDGCYRDEQALLARRPARWFVSGASRTIEVWRTERGDRDLLDGAGTASTKAVARRWGVQMSRGGWLRAAFTAATSKPAPLWVAAMPGEGVDVGNLDGVVVERVPTRQLPECREAPSFSTSGARHLAFAAYDEPQSPAFWTSAQPICAWSGDLPRRTDAAGVTTPEWVWRAVLGSRQSFPPGIAVEAGRAHLIVRMELVVPVDLRGRWRQAVDSLLPWLLAGLHSYEEADIREWLGRADPKALERIVGALTSPAPLGPARLIRSQKGTITDLPHRSDRVAAVRVAITEGDKWSVKAEVSTARKVGVH